jgi:nicotinamide mononucleotide transporter
MSVIEALVVQLLATTPLEAAAVALGVIYVVLIVRRNRLGWIAGGLSSAIYVYLAARARLPMQSALQLYYVLMAIYGWHTWTRLQAADSGRIERWPLYKHALMLVAIALASAVSAKLLARETHAAWPRLDSLTTWTSLFATWLVARMMLENWLYWIGADAVMAYLFAAQGYPFTAGLFLTYMIIALAGFYSWSRKYRLQHR